MYAPSGHQDGPERRRESIATQSRSGLGAVTPQAFVAALGRWVDGGAGAPVYRRLAGAIRAAIERGEVRPGERLPSERALAVEARHLPHDRRLGLRGSAPRSDDREPPRQRDAGPGRGAASSGAAAARGPVGLVPSPSRLAELHRGAGRHDRVSRRAPAGSRHPRAGSRADRREGAPRARAQPRLPPDGASGAAAGDRETPRRRRGSRRPRTRSS